MKKLNEYKDWAEIMTVREFKASCHHLAYTDDDGYGYPVINDDVLNDTIVLPSKLDEIPKEATHIVWFNK